MKKGALSIFIARTFVLKGIGCDFEKIEKFDIKFCSFLGYPKDKGFRGVKD